MTTIVSDDEHGRAGQDPSRPLVTGEDRELSKYLSLLRNREYRLWFASGLGSSLGDWAGLFALQVLVASLAEPGSRLALFGLGGIMMARLLPSVLFGPISGVLADRYDRKRLMVVTDLARGALFVGIAFSQDLLALFTLTFIVECMSLLYISAKDASLPVIVRRADLTQANQLNLLVTYGPLPFGAAAAAVMTALAALLREVGLADIDPTRLALLVNAGTFLVAGLIISRVRLPAHGRKAEHRERSGVLEELREGIDFIRGLPLVRALIMGVIGVFFGAGVIVTLGPEFVRAELGRSQTDWYTLMTAVGSGLLGGIVLVPFVTARIRKERVFPIALVLAAAIATVTATLPGFGQTLVAGLLLGAAAGFSFVTGYTLLHENTADATRARTFATFYTGTRVAMFAALGLAPFVAGAIGFFGIGANGRFVFLSGVRITILVGGVFALVSALSAWRAIHRSLRTHGGDEEPKPVRLAPPPGSDEIPTGLLIAFEGVEGAGKSTQVAALVETLRAEGHQVAVTREPGGPPVSERIRQLLLDPEDSMHPRTEALLYAAARAEHVQREILPALQQGKIVICDRFLDSSLAYQGFARGLGDADVFEINRWAVAGRMPDVVVLLDLDPEEGLERIATRRDEATDRIEREEVDFHRRVAEGYRALARRDEARFVVVDASDHPAVVARAVRDALRPWVPAPDADAGEDERGQAPADHAGRGGADDAGPGGRADEAGPGGRAEDADRQPAADREAGR